MIDVKITANLSEKDTLFTDKGIVQEWPSEGPEKNRKYKLFYDGLYYARVQLCFFNMVLMSLEDEFVETDIEFRKSIWNKYKKELMSGDTLVVNYGK